MDSFQKLEQSNPRYARFFKELVENEIEEPKEQERTLNRIARNFHAARNAIKNKKIDLLSVESVELLEDLIYKTHRDSQVERYAKDALSGIAKRRNVLQGPGRERALQAFGRIMDLNLRYEDAQKQYFKGISAVKTSEGLADLLENLLDSEIMEKVANSKAVVEYDDGRMALVWIPDFETSNKVGSHAWCISRSDGGKKYWDDYDGELNKCYMIVDRALPASHDRHQIAFHIDPDGNVTACHDQKNTEIKRESDYDFNQALKVTGARPYNFEDIFRSGDNSLLGRYLKHRADPAVLSKLVLTAENPVKELGRWFWRITDFTVESLPSLRRLVLRVARQYAKPGTGSVIDACFLRELSEADGIEECSSVAVKLVAMMPSIAVAKKHCTAEVFELFQRVEAKDAILRNAIHFGNRPLVTNMINNFWGRPSSECGFPFMEPERILSLGAKVNRLLLDSGFKPHLHDDKFVKAMLSPVSQVEKESAGVYLSTPWFKSSPSFTASLCRILQKEQITSADDQSKGSHQDCPLLIKDSFLIEDLKQCLGEKSVQYAEQIGAILAYFAGVTPVQVMIDAYLPHMNLLMDEVDRLKKESNKKVDEVLERKLGNIERVRFSRSFSIRYAIRPLSEVSRSGLGRLLAIMQSYGADISKFYMSVLVREGDFDRIARNCYPGKKATPISLECFIENALGRPECREGRVSDAWLADAEAWLQNDQSWFNEHDRDAIGRIFKALRGPTEWGGRVECVLKMADKLEANNYSSFTVRTPWQKRSKVANNYCPEAFDKPGFLAEFVQAAKAMGARICRDDLSEFLRGSSENVKKWAFCVGWDDIMTMVGEEGENPKFFIDDLLGSGFCVREGVRFGELPELSDLVKSLIRAEDTMLFALSDSVERTVPDFDIRAFAHAVNQYHGVHSSGDFMPLEDIEHSEPSQCLS